MSITLELSHTSSGSTFPRTASSRAKILTHKTKMQVRMPIITKHDSTTHSNYKVNGNF